MLANVLALAVALGSIALYLTAFVFPTLHRKQDFIWSGVGLFYALVLWVCAGRITGAVLLGQTASVALLGWLGWQTLLLRSQVTSTDGSPSPVDKLVSWANDTEATGILAQVKRVVAQAIEFVQSFVSQASAPSGSGAPASSAAGSLSFSKILADLQQKVLLLVALAKERVSPSEAVPSTPASTEPKEVYVRKKFRETPSSETEPTPPASVQDESTEAATEAAPTSEPSSAAAISPPTEVPSVSEPQVAEIVAEVVAEAVEETPATESTSADAIAETDVTPDEAASTSKPQPTEVVTDAEITSIETAPTSEHQSATTNSKSDEPATPETSPDSESHSTDVTAEAPPTEDVVSEATEAATDSEPAPESPDSEPPLTETTADAETASTDAVPDPEPQLDQASAEGSTAVDTLAPDAPEPNAVSSEISTADEALPPETASPEAITETQVTTAGPAPISKSQSADVTAETSEASTVQSDEVAVDVVPTQAPSVSEEPESTDAITENVAAEEPLSSVSSDAIASGSAQTTDLPPSESTESTEMVPEVNHDPTTETSTSASQVATGASSPPPTAFDQQLLERCHKSTQTVIHAAHQAAAGFGFTEIRPQDLLVGFLRVENSSNIAFAKVANVTLDRTWQVIEANYNEGTGGSIEVGELKFNSALHTILEMAMREAERKGHLPLLPAQLLLGLVQTADPDIKGILEELHVNVEQLQDHLQGILAEIESPS